MSEDIPNFDRHKESIAKFNALKALHVYVEALIARNHAIEMRSLFVELGYPTFHQDPSIEVLTNAVANAQRELENRQRELEDLLKENEET